MILAVTAIIELGVSVNRLTHCVEYSTVLLMIYICADGQSTSDKEGKTDG